MSTSGVKVSLKIRRPPLSWTGTELGPSEKPFITVIMHLQVQIDVQESTRAVSLSTDRQAVTPVTVSASD